MKNSDSGDPPFVAQLPWLRRITAEKGGDADTFDAVGDVLSWLEGQGPPGEGWSRADAAEPGYRALFQGPAGSGRTRAAAAIGRQSRRDVYRIDLAAVISGWMGETEKNLAEVFDAAEKGGWILFFAEADALFGRRTESRDANDRYPDQQIAYLLRRIEDFPGVVILATNLKSHLDEAFVRRLHAILRFPLPDADRRGER